MKLWWHKLTHWEYWSAKVVYLPALFLWVYFSIKFRSFRFYKYANPGIKNGGLYGDSKMEIYKLLPKNLFPKTILIHSESQKSINDTLKSQQLKFPLIVKPDIGCRGVGVQKVYNLKDILNYAESTNKAFLVQETVSYPNELGLFYFRMPNEKDGKITGITLKNFLTIEGNGIETIEQLLKQKPRFEMQIPALSQQLDLNEILKNGEKRCLVPFGNHNRGTAFYDGKELITNQLENTFNHILKQIKGFYFGRLDIRYNTFEELEKGMNFSIIEINGAKSEPTHMYDPNHSFWFGQREIFRHQFAMHDLVNVNIVKFRKGKITV